MVLFCGNVHTAHTTFTKLLFSVYLFKCLFHSFNWMSTLSHQTSQYFLPLFLFQGFFQYLIPSLEFFFSLESLEKQGKKIYSHFFPRHNIQKTSILQLIVNHNLYIHYLDFSCWMLQFLAIFMPKMDNNPFILYYFAISSVLFLFRHCGKPGSCFIANIVKRSEFDVRLSMLLFWGKRFLYLTPDFAVSSSVFWMSNYSCGGGALNRVAKIFLYRVVWGVKKNKFCLKF